MKIQTSTYNHLTKFNYCATAFLSFLFFVLVQSIHRCTVTIPRSCGNSSGYLYRYKQSCKPFWGFPGESSVKEPACQCRRCKRRRFDPRVGSSPGEGNGSPVQCSCLENSTDRGVWQATVPRVAKSQTGLKWFSAHSNFLKSFSGIFLHSFMYSLEITHIYSLLVFSTKRN